MSLPRVHPQRLGSPELCVCVGGGGGEQAGDYSQIRFRSSTLAEGPDSPTLY